MKKIILFLKNHWPILLITGIELGLFILNYTPKTYLVGWDNLFPEFNFGLNFKRTLFAVWQEYRGLGLYDGMSHAANLPHYILIYLLSLFFPQNILRYIFVFLMHWLGGVGMYFLLRNIFAGNKKLAALIGALFYQFSFATMQMFYLPFELFVTHFGYLPWLIFTLSKYLKTGSRKTLLYFALLSFLSSPQAHVPTVFIVYLLILAIFLLFHLLSHRRAALKHVVAIVLVTLSTNAYWALPFAHSTIQNTQIIASSKNNQMATDDIFLKNHEYGDFTNTALMRSFALEFVQYDHLAQKSDLMLRSWIDHNNKPYIVAISWFFFGLALFGGVYALYKRKKELYPFVALFFFVFAVIGNDIPVISIISYVFRTYVPLFHSIFRFVFTKFFFVYAFSYSVLLAVSVGVLLEAIIRRLKTATYVVAVILIGLIGLYAFPAFTGNFFHKQLKVEIPQDYFDTFEFFKNQPKDERIAVLPAPWYWAWTQYNWGVIGSGFQWFGIEQPILDRAFDPWSRENENFYWEVSQALYVSDAKRLEAVLEKYQVTWLLVDTNIIDPEKPAGNLKIEFLQPGEHITRKITFAAAFNRIKIYKFQSTFKANNFVSLYQTVPNIGPRYVANDFDNAALDSAIYVTDESKAINVYYPFRSLFTGKEQKDLEFTVEENTDSFVFRTPLPQNVAGYQLAIPTYNPESLTYIDKDNGSIHNYSYPKVQINGQYVYELNLNNASASAKINLPLLSEKLEVIVPKVGGYYNYDSDFGNDFEQEKKNCNAFNTGFYKHDLLTENKKRVLRLTSVNSNNCLNFPFPYLPQSLSYLVTLKTINISGRGMFFSVTNMQSGRTYLETYLENKPNEISKSNIIIPPLEPYSLGYSLNFDNISIGRVKTVNELRKITIYQIPYDFLVNLKLVKLPGFGTVSNSINLSQPTFIGTEAVSHPNPAEYWVDLKPNGDANQTLALFQAFDPGWIAFALPSCEPRTINCELKKMFPYLFGKRLTNHVRINNWANGWKLEEQNSNLKNQNCEPRTVICELIIYLVFWPQVLEFAGFGLLALPFLVLLKKRTK